MVTEFLIEEPTVTQRSDPLTSSANTLRTILNPYPSVGSRIRERVTLLMLANVAIGLVVLTGLGLFVGNDGPVTIGVALAFVWAAIPLGLAIAPRLGLSRDRAYSLSTLNLCGLITYLVILTGGLSSFLLAWFVIIPVEAMISGHRRRTAFAIGLTGLALALVFTITTLGSLPVSPFLSVSGPLLFAGASMVAALYVGILILNVQRLDQRAEKAALAGEERYRFLTDNALDMIIRHRPDGSMAYVSKACRAILGYSPDEMIAFEPGNLIYRADRKAVEIALSRASELGEDATIQFRMRHKNGDYIWLEMRCRPVASSNDADCPIINGSGSSLIGIGENFRPEHHEIIAVARDISKAKEHEQDLIRARELAEAGSRSKLHFLANVSHELRTPLSAINGFSDIMKREMFGPIGNQKYAEYAGLIHSSGNHLLELINDLLDMSKVEAGKYKIDHESIFFPVIIENCLRLIWMQLEKAGVKLHVDLPPSLPRLEADPRACKQILLNLLSNAIKFTEPGGSITISMFTVGPLQVLEVTDTGVGIDADDLERIGQPFEQARRSSDFAANDRAKAGTGLGLALVRSLTELHGGQFGIFSDKGEGTTVQIALPIKAPEGLAVDAPLPGIFNDGEAEDVGPMSQVSSASLDSSESLEDAA